MSTNPNHAAFPKVVPEGHSEVYHGLTKREYFAAKAMQGLLANPDIPEAFRGQ